MCALKYGCLSVFHLPPSETERPGMVVICCPEIKDSIACHMAIREEVVLTVSKKYKNNKGAWQLAWNAKMLASFLRFSENGWV